MSEQNSNNKKLMLQLAIGITLISLVGIIMLFPVKNNTNKNTIKTPQSQQTPKITINKNDHIQGDRNAPITMVEFSDFQCPYCKRFHPTMQRVMREYKGQVRWIYRHFPLNFHRNSQKSAEASECAGEQGKFWKFVDKMFENSQPDGAGLDIKDLQRYAKEMKLNTTKFNSCLSTGKFADKVAADMNSGKLLGITGTPGTILIDKNGNTQLITGARPYNEIKAIIDSVLK